MSFIGYADPAQLKLLSQALSEYCRANGIAGKNAQLRQGGRACGFFYSKAEFQASRSFRGHWQPSVRQRGRHSAPSCRLSYRPLSSRQSRSVAWRNGASPFR